MRRACTRGEEINGHRAQRERERDERRRERRREIFEKINGEGIDLLSTVLFELEIYCNLFCVDVSRHTAYFGLCEMKFKVKVRGIRENA
jgi:hypothetical protein